MNWNPFKKKEIKKEKISFVTLHFMKYKNEIKQDIIFFRDEFPESVDRDKYNYYHKYVKMFLFDDKAGAVYDVFPDIDNYIKMKEREKKLTKIKSKINV